MLHNFYIQRKKFTISRKEKQPMGLMNKRKINTEIVSKSISVSVFFQKKIPTVGGDVLCQEQDCKQLCKRIVYTFYVESLRFWKPNGA